MRKGRNAKNCPGSMLTVSYPRILAYSRSFKTNCAIAAGFRATVGLRQMRLLRPAETTEGFMTTVFDPAEPQRIDHFFSMPAAWADRLRGLFTLANDWSSDSRSATTVFFKGRNS